MTVQSLSSLHGVLLGLVAIGCAGPGAGGSGQVADPVPCAQFGEEVHLAIPPGAEGVGAWPRAAAFAQGALLASGSPGAVNTFADPRDTSSASSPSTDSAQVCFAARSLGRVGDVSFIQVLMDLKRPSGPVEKGEVFLAVGPDSAHFLIGHDRRLHSPFRNVLRVSDINMLLSRYALAREDAFGRAHRLEVAAVLLGGDAGGASYRVCRTNPSVVVATLDDGQRREFTMIEFASSGRIVGARQSDSAATEC